MDLGDILLSGKNVREYMYHGTSYKTEGGVKHTSIYFLQKETQEG